MQAVVVPAYNRPATLQDTLNGLAATEANRPIDLIVSIDGGDRDCIVVADNFAWKFGEKQVVVHGRLGLKQHILTCGDITRNYDWVAVIEDDILVSPYWMDFACSTVFKLGDDDRIAGISLYDYEVSEVNGHVFRPVEDGKDNYFMQFASSWGQLWTRRQWRLFRAWLTSHDCEGFDDRRVPISVSNWPATSWKKHFIRYLVDTNRFFCFPRVSLSTCPGVDGTHQINMGDVYNVPLLEGAKMWNIGSLDESRSVYGADFLPIDVPTKDRALLLAASRAEALRDKYGIGIREAIAILRSSVARRWSR